MVMLRRLLAVMTALVITGLATAAGLSQAVAATSPNVTITATAAADGTATLTYRATATAAFELRIDLRAELDDRSDEVAAGELAASTRHRITVDPVPQVGFTRPSDCM